MAALKLRLTFPMELSSEPVIYNLVRRYNIITNIRRASVTQDSAWIALELTGKADELEKAVKYLKSIGIEVK